MSLAPILPRRGSALRARLPLAGVLVLAVLAGCQSTPKEDPAVLRSALDTINRQFMEAFSNKDGAALGLLYTEDAIALPPGAVQVEGRAAIEAMWKGMLSLPLSAIELKTSETGGGVETAWEVGQYRLLQNDESVADAGKYIVIWKKTEAGWKVHRDIWNSDAPSATPASETPSPHSRN